MNNLFYKVFHNNFIRLNILKHLKLYRKNKVVCFKSINELLNYQFREYIQVIEFYGDEQFAKYDLPEYGVLKKLVLGNNNCLLSYGNECVIPNGVDTIKYSYKMYPSDTTSSFFLINKFIKSINTIENCMIDPTRIDYSNNMYGNNYLYTIGGEPIFKSLPPNLTSISFHQSWNFKIPNGFFNSNTKELIFGNEFNNGNSDFIKIGDIPFGVEKFDLGGYCKGIIPNSLPSSIIDLSILIPNNKFLKLNSIPSSVKKLVIYTPNVDDNYYYEKEDIVLNEIGILPNGIKRLDINSWSVFISSWDVLPNSINHLKMNTIPHDIPIVKGTLPNCLEYFSFYGGNYKFTFEIDSFPSTLKELYIGEKAYNNRFKPNVLPQSLTSLTLPTSYNQQLEFGTLPIGLIKFTAGDHKIQPGILPSSLKKLIIQAGEYNLEIGSLPNGLTFLELPYMFNQSFLPNNILPSSITHLQFGSFYNQPFSKSILSSLSSLKTLIFYTHCIPSIYSHPLIDILPSSLIYLFIGNPNYSHPIKSSYKTPHSIKKYGKSIKNLQKKPLKSLL